MKKALSLIDIIRIFFLCEETNTQRLETRKKKTFDFEKGRLKKNLES